ncbi:hypothetical protein JCM19046_393 [Bacillus sp. JCM 19046]|nr:hypothetical protein JCM19045_2686 [Bacillus sp. JCM 19045]GAF15989.1 hypothetical protein JCM19046_393 [Bacillus sp. JCM 19046]
MWIYFILVNSVGLIAMAIDKAHAKKQARRIPEKNLWGLGFIGGSLGLYTGMYLFRHKTRKQLFVIGLPVLIIVQTVIGLFIYRLL